MPNYSYICLECNSETVESFPSAERPDHIQCGQCGREGAAEYRISAPNITRASYIDGTRRFDDFREARKLQEEKWRSSDKGHRKAIEKEIREKIKVDIEK